MTKLRIQKSIQMRQLLKRQQMIRLPLMAQKAARLQMKRLQFHLSMKLPMIQLKRVVQIKAFSLTEHLQLVLSSRSVMLQKAWHLMRQLTRARKHNLLRVFALLRTNTSTQRLSPAKTR